jgi:hypothetical protein
MPTHQIISHERAEFLELLKRVAKQRKKQGGERSLSAYQDAVATELGYPNWSVLHRNVMTMEHQRFVEFRAHIQSYPEVQAILFTSPAFLEAAEAEMKEWMRTNYTPLIEFAYYDNESENGFSLPSEDVNNLLQDEFAHRFPLDLIMGVAHELELDGPWGDEKYWLGGDEPPPEFDAA